MMPEACCEFEESKESFMENLVPNPVDFSACKFKNANRENRSVSFSNLEVKYFKFDLGDSLGVARDDGPPLTISWDSFEAIVMPISLYESVRQPRGPVPTIKSEERMNILLRNGVDIAQIEETMSRMKIRKEETLEELRPTKARRKMIKCVKRFIMRQPRGQ